MMTDQSMFWICNNPEPILPHDGLAGQADLCRHCGGTPLVLHPVAICTGCPHRVDFHGADTDGCSAIGVGGWCRCQRTFDRSEAVRV